MIWHCICHKRTEDEKCVILDRFQPKFLGKIIAKTAQTQISMLLVQIRMQCTPLRNGSSTVTTSLKMRQKYTVEFSCCVLVQVINALVYNKRIKATSIHNETQSSYSTSAMRLYSSLIIKRTHATLVETLRSPIRRLINQIIISHVTGVSCLVIVLLCHERSRDYVIACILTCCVSIPYLSTKSLQ